MPQKGGLKPPKGAKQADGIFNRTWLAHIYILFLQEKFSISLYTSTFLLEPPVFKGVSEVYRTYTTIHAYTLTLTACTPPASFASCCVLPVFVLNTSCIHGEYNLYTCLIQVVYSIKQGGIWHSLKDLLHDNPLYKQKPAHKSLALPSLPIIFTKNT